MPALNAEEREAQRRLALNPSCSAVVEACAGSGKTWLLSSRLLRLLLAGTKPGEILAITYTRKAAREIEARLRSLLVELASASDEHALLMLRQRGLSEDEALIRLPHARSLFEVVLQADPPITITTFHGWFARLLSGAPLESGLAGRSLDEASQALHEEAWANLANDCAREPDGALAESLIWLYAELGAAMTGKLLRALVERRAEWRVWQDSLGGLDAVLARQAEDFGLGRNPLAELLQAERLRELEEFALLLAKKKTDTDQALAAPLAQEVANLLAGGALQAVDEEAFRIICTAFLTKEGMPRKRKSSKTQLDRLGAAGDERFLQLHADWSERLLATLGALQDRHNAILNRHALVVGEALLGKLQALKAGRRVMDFSDLEAEVDALLGREGTAAWLQARLDARYRHILLDEFQDTNPLQWRILRAWLDAYADAGMVRPSVFLVGDPKQSIYRFRRAEPKLFTAAVDYFTRHFDAVSINNAHTYRNAQGVVDLVNAVFAGQQGFGVQTAERQTGWPSYVAALPLIPLAARDLAEAAAPEGMRLPLERARIEAEDLRRTQEAELLARQIREIVGLWRVRDNSGERAASYADILILTRRKTHLATYEAALRGAGIPYVSPGQGGLLDTLEARDVLAVLSFLADPSDALSLAHALKTPAFALDDEMLLDISVQPGAWWTRLQGLAAEAGGKGEELPIQRAVRLLSGWMAASAHLPAHDLIDRIFHESDWLARTRAALPDALWPGVHANLEALLELALTVDAGRYPSLTRFVDEMRRLARADDEAPDEGLIATDREEAGEVSGRVRIMTIHGAKGLEAPIVWLIDAHSLPRKAEGYGVAMEWPPGAVAPSHFSLLGRMAEVGPARQAWLSAEREAAEREELNLLYVALTRAEQVFVVSGIEASRNLSGLTAWQRVASALDELGAVDGRLGGLPAQAVLTSIASATSRGVPRPRSLPAVGQLRAGGLPPSQEGAAGLGFGLALHAWLDASLSARPLPVVDDAVRRSAQGVLERPELRRFFDPRQYLRAVNEGAFILDGQVGRMDRWVEFEEEVWVLDYKSGEPDADRQAEYVAQLRRYREALAQVFPHKPVRGMLIFSAGGAVEC